MGDNSTYGKDLSNYGFGGNLNRINNKYHNRNGNDIAIYFDKFNCISTTVDKLYDYKYFVRVVLSSGSEYIVSNKGKIIELNKDLYVRSLDKSIILENEDDNGRIGMVHVLRVKGCTKDEDILVINEYGKALLIKTGYGNMDWAYDELTDTIVDILDKMADRSKYKLGVYSKIKELDKLARTAQLYDYDDICNKIDRLEEVSAGIEEYIGDLKYELDETNITEDEYYIRLFVINKDTSEEFELHITKDLEIVRSVRDGQPIDVEAVILN